MRWVRARVVASGRAPSKRIRGRSRCLPRPCPTVTASDRQRVESGDSRNAFASSIPPSSRLAATFGKNMPVQGLGRSVKDCDAEERTYIARTSRTKDGVPLYRRVERWRRCTPKWTLPGGARCRLWLGVAGGIRFASERLRANLARHKLMQGCITLEFNA